MTMLRKNRTATISISVFINTHPDRHLCKVQTPWCWEPDHHYTPALAEHPISCILDKTLISTTVKL